MSFDGSPSLDSDARLPADILDSNQDETIQARQSADENDHVSQPMQSKTAAGEEPQHVTFGDTTQHDPAAQFADTNNTYYSAQSKLTFGASSHEAPESSHKTARPGRRPWPKP